MSALPYDMGNAGDLLKHGILAALIDWVSRSGRPVTFVDPFGGHPWDESPLPEVRRRVQLLAETPLGWGQTEPERRYFGSGHVALHAAQRNGVPIRVLVSDRDPGRLSNLLESGLERFTTAGFSADDSYSALTAEFACDLVLFDPFNDLVSQGEKILPLLAAISERMIAVTFVLDAPRSEEWIRARKAHLPNAFVARVPPLSKTGVRGEGRYEVEVLVSMPRGKLPLANTELAPVLADYCRVLGSVLGAEIMFTTGVRTS